MSEILPDPPVELDLRSEVRHSREKARRAVLSLLSSGIDIDSSRLEVMACTLTGVTRDEVRSAVWELRADGLVSPSAFTGRLQLS